MGRVSLPSQLMGLGECHELRGRALVENGFRLILKATEHFFVPI